MRATLARVRSHRGAWAAALAWLCLFNVGCHTTTNIVTIRSLDTKVPVSASSSYVDASGEIVDASQYSVVRDFAFEKHVDVPRHSTRETALVLEPELNRIAEETRAEALTNLAIEPDEYDAGSHSSAATAKNWMYPFLVLGLAIGVGSGIKLADHPDDGRWQGLLITGAAVTAVGGLLWVVSSLDSDPGRWRFKVRGDAVKRRPTNADLPRP